MIGRWLELTCRTQPSGLKSTGLARTASLMSPRRRRKLVVTLAELGPPIQVKPTPTLPCERCGKAVAILTTLATAALCYDCWVASGRPA